jgi:hypothetical protein
MRARARRAQAGDDQAVKLVDIHHAISIMQTKARMAARRWETMSVDGEAVMCHVNVRAGTKIRGFRYDSKYHLPSDGRLCLPLRQPLPDVTGAA